MLVIQILCDYYGELPGTQPLVEVGWDHQQGLQQDFGTAWESESQFL